MAPRSEIVKITSPSEEETLFADHVITIAGRTIILTGHDLLMVSFSILSGIVLWLAIYFTRKRTVVLKRSNTTDHIEYELSRIADALERIANRPADSAIASAMQQQAPPPLQRESTGVLYSMFER